MKILFVTNRYPTPRTPGDSPCIARQREALERLGYEVDVLFIDSQRSRMNYLKAVWQIFWKTQIRRQYDIVHAHYGYYCGLAACAQSARPTIVTFRGSDLLYKPERGVSRLAARFASHSIVMSDEMKRILGDDAAQIIPYGIDLELFKPGSRNAARQQLGLPRNSPLVLFPYDPARQVKRFDLVEQTVSILKNEFPDIQVIAICDKPYESIPVYMNACDVMVLTSTSEGAPVAVREAMACNLPIVSVDVGDVAEVIGTSAGCAIADRDPQDIADHVSRILRSEIRSNGRQSALPMSVSHYAREIASIYDRYDANRKQQPVPGPRRPSDLVSSPPRDQLIGHDVD